MKVVLIYLVLPFSILIACLYGIRIAWGYSPQLVLAVCAVLVLIGLLQWYKVHRLNLRRGWRVGCIGRDELFYEEMIRGRWERIIIDGEMLCDGPPNHVIYIPSAEKWRKFPDWAQGRKEEITNRLKQVLVAPRYEYAEGDSTASAGG